MSFQGFRYTNGEFATKMDVTFMQDMYDAITKADAWDFVKQDPGDGGFMFCTNPIMHKITLNMKYAHDHSGASFACMMRLMQQLAVVGEDKFRNLYFPM